MKSFWKIDFSIFILMSVQKCVALGVGMANKKIAKEWEKKGKRCRESSCDITSSKRFCCNFSHVTFCDILIYFSKRKILLNSLKNRQNCLQTV
jgi:hypothetical protein